MAEVGAVIEVGTNSVKFLLADCRDGQLNVLRDVNEVARLGEGLRRTGMLSPEAIERNAAAVARFANFSGEAGARDIAVVGTMAMRTAGNADAFIRRVRELSGLDLAVISGEEEARLSYLAAISGIDARGRDVVTFDTGGGSTEFVFGDASGIRQKISIDIGAVRLTEDFFSDDPVAPGSVERAAQTIAHELQAGGVRGSADLLVGIGGTVTTMSAVAQKMEPYDAARVQGSVLSSGEVSAQVAMYAGRTLAARRQIPGLPAKRADVILAGACIVSGILTILGAHAVVVSDRGLRHEVLTERMTCRNARH